MTAETAEARAYKSASKFVFDQMPYHPSIVNTSILSAIDGEFGDHHVTYRTQGSELFINPLMSLYWSFDVDSVVARNLYIERLADTETFGDVRRVIGQFRDEVETIRPWVSLPM